jgi:anaerobic nitric oxide reductase transcription regulator
MQDRAGRFEAAQGGTLFLDEVGELPLSVQAKLLRTLQNGEIQRLGTDATIKTDVRIIAATNRQLKENTLEGTFRADLYHRLSVYPVHIPPLRERDRDVLVLAGHFLEFNRARLGVRGLRLSYGAEEALLRYPWPGNVRELEHVISRAALKMLSRGAPRDQILTLPADLLDLDLPRETMARTADTEHMPSSLARNGEPADLSSAIPGPLRTALDQHERALITQALRAANENWAKAARLLEIDSSNLHKRAKRLGLKTA